jgi:Fe-S cluster biogenesis protein NfuA
MQGHQPAMSRLVKEVEAVVERTRPIVGGGGGASTLFHSTEVDVEMR